MNSRPLFVCMLKYILCSIMAGWATDLPGQGTSAGGMTSTAPGSAGTGSVRASYQSTERSQAAWRVEQYPVLLPAGAVPIGLSDDGVVLLYLVEPVNEWPYEERRYYRWINGRLNPLQVESADSVWAACINRNGDVLIGYYRNGASCMGILTLQGVLQELDMGPQNFASVLHISNGFGVGNLKLTFHEEPNGEGGLVTESWAAARWNLAAGTYEQLGEAGPTQFLTSVSTVDVNDQGDYLSSRIRLLEDDHTYEVVGYFLNNQALDFSPYRLNNHRSVIGVDLTSYLPIYQRGAQRLMLGNLTGYPTSLNDNDDILIDQYDGRSVLWQKTLDVNGVASFHDTNLAELTGMDVKETIQINNRREILFTTHGENFQDRAYLLTTVRLGVDFDRDGVIDTSRAADNSDRELARRHLPWHFWINDDDDAGETDGTDVPGKGSNAQDNNVNGVRDLVDFFPVHLDIAGLLQAYPAADSTITYRLCQADGAANFITTGLTPAKVGDYQRDAEVARTLGSAPVTQITADGVVLDRTFLEKIVAEGRGIILLEARKKTTAPLQLIVWRGATKLGAVELPLSFDNVEAMFRHKNLTEAVNITSETLDRKVAPNWPDELNNNQAFVFVHGYNVNQERARGWHAETFKRLWWSGSNAQFWGVTWYGTASQRKIGNGYLTANYQANVIHAFGTAPKLAEFINDELKQHAGAGFQINIAGHSLGNMVVSSAISDQGARVNHYFMIDAAVAAEAYDGDNNVNYPGRVVQIEDRTADMPHTEWNKDFGGVYPSKLWATNWHKLFQTQPGDKRSTLTWRNRFALKDGVDYFDFHSEGEEVLDHTDSRTPSLPFVLLQTAANKLGESMHFSVPFIGTGQPAGHKSWQYQEQLKGRTITGKVLGSNFGGWGFNYLHFKKSPSGAGGRGPVLVPAILRPTDITQPMLNDLFTDEVLREEPFFKPGGRWQKVGSWTSDLQGRPDFLKERLSLLYDSSTGSGFASRHLNTLLARMIPAMSPAAGRIPVPKLGDLNSNNFDMNGLVIRPNRDAQGNPRWPTERGQDFRWWHSDLREVAYLYVRGLYGQMTISGNLEAAAP